MSSNTRITPLLLCGGSGTRLWPVSRKSYPKQFTRVLGGDTLFQRTALRFKGNARYASPVIITASDFRFAVTEQLSEVNVTPSAVLIEPEPRNTAPAVLAGALHLVANDPDVVMLVAPSDHVIADVEAFHLAVEKGLAAIASGELVTFGITPDRPETGYGYLELTGRSDESGEVSALRRFVEKPDSIEAGRMMASGRHLWNAGIFLARGADLVAAFRKYAPEVVAYVEASLANARIDFGFLRLGEADFAAAPSISIDYAVMEKTDNLAVVPFSAGWSDLGDWEAIWREQGADEDGVVLSGRAESIDCANSLLRSEADGQVLVGIGLDNIIAVAMPDAVLIASRDRSQDVKAAVTLLKSRGASQAESLPRDYRPWGWYETLALASRFQVKRIVVHPGAALSLQSHHHRSEHWVVVEGTARVTIGEQVKLVTENQSVYIPPGTIHRMENPGKLPMVLIEVQTGSYLKEDDILRYEDIYARANGSDTPATSDNKQRNPVAALMPFN